MLNRIFAAWIVLASVLAFAVGASLFSEPSDCFQYGTGQRSQQTTHADDAAPSTASAGNRDHSADKATKAEHDCKPWWGPEWFLVWVTCGLVLITGTLAIYTGLLWGATKTLVADAQNTSRRQLRAYIHPDSVTLWDGSTLTPPQMHRANKPGVVLQWRNTGETPAKDVIIWSRVAVLSPKNESKFNAPAFLVKRFPNTLGRGIPGTRAIWHRRILTPQQAADVGSGKLGIYFYGRIEYRDIFGSARWTTFKFVYSGSSFPPIGSGTFSICEGGNATDEEAES